MVKGRNVNPASLGPAVGYSHGTRAGNLLFVAGQIGGHPKGDGSWHVHEGFVQQLGKALENVVEVIRAEGGLAEDIVEMVIYIKDMAEYRKARKELAGEWKRVLGKHYPAVTLVEVSDLFEPGTLVEIRAVALLE
jgi:enamine deaminase RidA (YjgF/YER057c/UK114 family)